MTKTTKGARKNVRRRPRAAAASAGRGLPPRVGGGVAAYLVAALAEELGDGVGAVVGLALEAFLGLRRLAAEDARRVARLKRGRAAREREPGGAAREVFDGFERHLVQELRGLRRHLLAVD